MKEIKNLCQLELKRPELTTKKKVIDDAEAEIVLMKEKADEIHVEVRR